MIQPGVSLLTAAYISRKYKQNELANIFLLDIHKNLLTCFFTHSPMFSTYTFLYATKSSGDKSILYPYFISV